MPPAFVQTRTVSAPKMADVVCARNFFLAKGDEADFASDCIHYTLLFQLTLKTLVFNFVYYNIIQEISCLITLTVDLH
jgi:hypothetical protein